MDARTNGLKAALAAPTPAENQKNAASTNRAFLNRQTASDATGSTRETGGCDWLEAGLYGAFQAEAFDELARQFDGLKRSAKDTQQPEFFTLPDGTAALMHPYGATLGFGGMEWVIEVSGIKFFIAARRDSTDSIGIWFRATGEVCMPCGHLAIFKEVLRVVGLLGWCYHRSCAPCRFDACVDLPGQSMSTILDFWNGGQVVKHGRTKWKIEGEGLQTQTLEVGKRGRQQIIFYDKLAELSTGDAKSERKYDYLVANRWGGEPDAALRIEIRIKSDWLRRQTNVKSCEEFFSMLPGILERLLLGDDESSAWLRVVEGKIDRENGNQSRAQAGAWWRSVVDKFLAWAGDVVEMPVKPQVRNLYGQRLFKQWQGFTATLAAVQGRTFDGMSGLAFWLAEQIYDGEGAKTFATKLHERMQQLGTEPPS